MKGKIALEEHFLTDAYQIEDLINFKKVTSPEYFEDMSLRLKDDRLRLEEMDKTGVQLCVLSLTQPGIQAELDVNTAISRARQMNDVLFEHSVSKHPDRFAGFAALPLQNPEAAAKELERTVREYGFKGAMINGYTDLDKTNIEYLDEKRIWPFWEAANNLRVPIYLHPRTPHWTQHRIYKGYQAELLGSTWGFGVETATHALRLIMSGLFDAYPNVNLVLGHLGECLPYAVHRLDHRLKFQKPQMRGRQKNSVSYYLKNNFFVTTSGFFSNSALTNTISEIGSDRILFSTDYPYESMREASDWFDQSPVMTDEEREKIGRSNALALLNMKD
jgi:gamma-resorcylate decarboxylase